MPDVKSPYNFVPAPTETEVYIPKWDHQVSHDIPFSDGQSGEITLKITAETPIFIRNGHSKQDADIFEKYKKDQLPNPSPAELDAIQRYLSFSNINGQYFIPATSIKGMLRNVLEIISFSRMMQVDNDKFAIRDLSKNDNFYMKQMKSSDGNKTHAGWLVENAEGNWSIIDCGEPGRINHQELKDKKGLSFRDDFLNKEPKNDDEKTARHKYELASKQSGFSFVDTFNTVTQDTRLKAFYSPDGKKGTIVFTGQPGKRREEGTDKKRYNGKFYEFVFFESQATPIQLSEVQKHEFLFVYNDSKKDDVSKDWLFWREKLKNGERVPVFFKKTKSGIEHFGLAYLYKLPYKYSIHDLLPYSSYNSDNGLDLSEVIFGKIGKVDKEYSLKGRVHISHAFSKNANPFTESVKEIMGSPKPSYFPFYLQQSNPDDKYINYSSTKPTLNGFKRYPVHKLERGNTYTAKQLKNEKVFSKFIPLEKGATFEFKIRFHNLREIELGALISAITFHGNNAQLSHNLGAAKSFGFGRVKIDILKGDQYSRYMPWFEDSMNQFLKKKWIESNQIAELFSMATLPKNREVEESLVYPQLELPNVPSSEANEFVNYKKQNQVLNSYSTINGKLPISSLLTDEVLKQIDLDKYHREQELKRIENEKKEAERLKNEEIANLLSSAENAVQNNDYTLALMTYQEIHAIDPSKIELDEKIESIKIHELNYLKEEEQKRRLNEVLTCNDPALISKFLLDYPLTQAKQQLEMKLSRLKASSGIPERLKTMTDWERFKGEAPKWIKKVKDAGEFVRFEAEFQDIVEKVARIQHDSEKTKKVWLKGTFETNHEWKKVTEWLGEARAKKLYDELTTNSK